MLSPVPTTPTRPYAQPTLCARPNDRLPENLTRLAVQRMREGALPPRCNYWWNPGVQEGRQSVRYPSYS